MFRFWVFPVSRARLYKIVNRVFLCRCANFPDITGLSYGLGLSKKTFIVVSYMAMSDFTIPSWSQYCEWKRNHCKSSCFSSIVTPILCVLFCKATIVQEYGHAQPLVVKEDERQKNSLNLNEVHAFFKDRVGRTIQCTLPECHKTYESHRCDYSMKSEMQLKIPNIIEIILRTELEDEVFPAFAHFRLFDIWRSNVVFWTYQQYNLSERL